MQDDIDCQIEFMQVHSDDIMQYLAIPHNWRLSMKDGATPILAELQHQ